MNDTQKTLVVLILITAMTIFQIRYREFLNLRVEVLPTLSEAMATVHAEHPDFADRCSLVQKTIGEENNLWGSFLTFEAYFLDCPDVGVSIQVRIK